VTRGVDFVATLPKRAAAQDATRKVAKRNRKK
jgi:hypothetical protein